MGLFNKVDVAESTNNTRSNWDKNRYLNKKIVLGLIEFDVNIWPNK